ncbi:MAG: AMP phosphorylase [Conexivisphaerales archaeon]
MQLLAQILDIEANKKSAILNDLDAEKFGLTLNDRVHISSQNGSITCIVELSSSLVKPGTIALYKNVAKSILASNGEKLEVNYEPTPQSVEFIRKKMNGEKLSEGEIKSIINDLVKAELSDLDISAFLLASNYIGLNEEEIKNITISMVETGQKLNLRGFTVDKHSIGGVPGNKVSLLIVPTVALTELLIPKTSSKAITSPSGTADTMSILANVKFELNEIKSIVEKVHGCIVWGGALDIAPADDLLIRIENPLRIDPKGLMIASILSKKLAVGAKVVALDIPAGRGAKISDSVEGEKLAKEFIEIGKTLGINIRAGITYGGQPVGKAIGPALEAREALSALIDPNLASMSLLSKASSLAGILLETAGLASRNTGYDISMGNLLSGKSYNKMKQIIAEQGGNPEVQPDQIPVGSYKHEFKADNDGYIILVDNESIVRIAKAAGAPVDSGSGIILHKKQGYKVRKGDVLFEIYSDKSSKLSEAVNVANYDPPIIIEGMLLKVYPT